MTIEQKETLLGERSHFVAPPQNLPRDHPRFAAWMALRANVAGARLISHWTPDDLAHATYDVVMGLRQVDGSWHIGDTPLDEGFFADARQRWHDILRTPNASRVDCYLVVAGEALAVLDGCADEWPEYDRSVFIDGVSA